MSGVNVVDMNQMLFSQGLLGGRSSAYDAGNNMTAGVNSAAQALHGSNSWLSKETSAISLLTARTR